MYPTNVSIDCNTGAYLSAVKPALELIVKGWQTEILSTLIHCEDLIPRSEMSGRKVSTKLVLYLTENKDPYTKIKVVLHFYHTSSTLQVQGSSLLSCGTSAPVWLVENFLEPLAASHVARHGDTIDAINTHIRQSNSTSHHCALCRGSICSTAPQAKDQELSCSKCLRHFHKRCTDRRKTTGNWRKAPWFCENCVLGNQPSVTGTGNDPIVSPDLSPHAQIFLPRSQDPPPLRSIRRSIITVPGQSNEFSQATQTSSQALVLPQDPHQIQQDGQPHNALEVSDDVSANNEPDVINIQPPSSPPVHRAHVFPTAAMRHRTTNINLDNPEAEFQKTALDSCRSTIIQQQSEIKRLGESLDIRNKRIMQLESQIGVAASYMSNRDSNTSTARMEANTDKDKSLINILNDHLALIINKFDVLIDKVCTKQPGVNIYNTTSTSNKPNNSSTCKSTQTVTDNADTATEKGDEVAHLEDNEKRMVDEVNIGEESVLCTKRNQSISCDYCEEKLLSAQKLQEHISQKHATSFLQCPKCLFRTQLRTKLNDHLRNCHIEPPPSQSSLQSL